LRAELPSAFADLALPWLDGFSRAAHALVSPGMLSVAGLGLALLLAGVLALRSQGRRLRVVDAIGVIVVSFAVVCLLWTTYLDVGLGLYGRASVAHREGSVGEAISLYQQVEGFYPFEVDRFVTRTRQGLRECVSYQKAESAHQSAAYESAVHRYEAFLVGNPAIGLRESAQAQLLASLYGWGEMLEGAGEYERALDRYRFIRDEYREPQVWHTIADLYLARGEALEAEEDYRGAIETYRRIARDVPDPRLWAVAEEEIAGACSAWVASLQVQGQAEQAARVCKELLDELPARAGGRCPGCGP
jgi:tetratricopeptide (TPR) repeat protein